MRPAAAFAFAAALLGCNEGNSPADATDAGDTGGGGDTATQFENCFNGVDDNGDSLVDCGDAQCQSLAFCNTYRCPGGDIGAVEGIAVLAASTVGARSNHTGTCGGRGGDLALRWVAPRTDTYFIDTRGSGYDTILYVLDGGCGGAELACNDDDPTLPALTSEVTIDAREGREYLIVIDGYDVVAGEGGGHALLNITPRRTSTEQNYCFDRRDNDNDGRFDCADPDCSAAPLCAPLTGAVSVAAGASHSCAALDSGDVVCWGGGGRGQLGDRSRRTSPRPARIGGDYVAVRAAGDRTCAVTADARVACWGSGDNDFFGLGWGTDANEPVDAGVEDVARLDIGTSHACALDSTGGLRCWGDNSWGQLGDGTREARATGRAVAAASPEATDLCVGGGFTCVVDAAGGVQCVGSNHNGQLGVASLRDRQRFGPVPGVTDAVGVRCGAGHACALHGDGDVTCWGRNWNGELGVGSVAQQLGPLPVALDADAVDLRAGDSHTCAIDSAGAAWCWGAGYQGQLGDGGTTQRSLPGRASLDVPVAEVAAGSTHTCWRLEDGTVHCSGNNASGQLGNDTRTQRVTPVPVLAAAPTE